MNFKVNKYTIIKDFELTGVFENFMKHGELSKYERFTGNLCGNDITGWVCLADNNIYNIECVDHEKAKSRETNS